MLRHSCSTFILKYSGLILASLVVACFFAPESTNAAIINQSTTTRMTNGLVGYWTFDGHDVKWNTNKAIDRTGNSTTGNLEGMSTSTSPVTGVMGQALKFNGVNSDINIGAPSALDLNNNYSINFWIFPDANFTGTVIRQSSSAVNTTSLNKYEIRVLTTGVLFITGDGTDFDSDGFSTTLDAQKWTMITCTLTTGNLKSCYKNTTLIGTSTNDVDTSLVTPAAGFIGTNRNTATNNFYEGRLDDLRVYNRVLSTADITHLYNMGNQVAAQSSSRALRITSGLLGHWTFDGPDVVSTGTVVDRSSAGNHGYYIGAATSSAVVPGKIGQALKFSGDLPRVRTNSDNVGTGDITLSLWMKPYTIGTETGADKYIFSNARFRLYQSNSGNNRLGVTSNGGTNSLTSGVNSIATKNKWYHVVVTRASDGTTTFYIDNVITTTGSSGTPQAGVNNITISTNNGTNPFVGELDDVRLYSRILSTAEIKALYNMGTSTVNQSTNTRLTNGLIGLWSFNGPDLLSNVTDRSGQGNHGFLVNFAATSTVVTPGKIGQALNFNGTGYVSLSTSLTNGTSIDLAGKNFTFAAWAKSTVAANGRVIFLYANPQSRNTGLGTNNSSNQNRFQFLVATSTAGSSSVLQCNNVNPVVGTWYHVAGVWNGTNSLIYVDGTLCNTSSADTNTRDFSGDRVQIGARNGNSPWVGPIDDVRLYTRALSSSEIYALYNMGR